MLFCITNRVWSNSKVECKPNYYFSSSCMETLDKKLTIHEEFAYLWVTTDLMNKWRGNKHMKGKENPPDSIIFFLEEK